MKQKKTNRVALLLHWAGEQKVWLFLAVLLAMAGGLCIVVPYIEIYRLMDAAFGGTCTEELVVRVVAAVAAAVVLRFVLFGASGVVSHKGAYGALFKVRCMVAEHMAKVPLGALNERRTGDIKTVLNEDIEKLANYIKEMTGVGILTPDSQLEDYVREAAHLPERLEDDTPAVPAQGGEKPVNARQRQQAKPQQQRSSTVDPGGEEDPDGVTEEDMQAVEEARKRLRRDP